MKVQINISKQAQESIKRITEMSKITVNSELAKHLEQMQKAASIPIRDATLQMTKIIEAAQIFDKIDFNQFAKRNEQAINQILRSQELFAKNFKLNHLNVIESFVQNMNRIQSELTIAVSIPNIKLATVSQSLLNSIPKINFLNLDKYLENEYINREIEDLNANTFQDLIDYFEEKINSLPRGTIIAQGMVAKLERVVMYLMLFFAILNYLNNRQTSAQNETIISQQKQTNEYLESLEGFTENIYPKIEALLDDEKEENLLVVKKTSILRVSPTSKSDSLTTIFSNQLVNTIKEENRWYYIEYFDHREVIPRMGWIYKGNVDNYSQKK